MGNSSNADAPEYDTNPSDKRIYKNHFCNNNIDYILKKLK